MMPVSVVGSSAPRRDDHHWSKRANHTNHVRKHSLAIPLLQSFSSRFAKAKIKCSRKELLRAIESSRCKQLFGAYCTERFVKLGADEILTSVSARERQVSRARLAPARQISKQSAVFIIRM